MRYIKYTDSGTNIKELGQLKYSDRQTANVGRVSTEQRQQRICHLTFHNVNKNMKLYSKYQTSRRL